MTPHKPQLNRPFESQVCRISEFAAFCVFCTLLVFTTSCSPEGRDAVVGIWQQQKENGVWNIIEFRRDGTFLEHDSFGTHPMKYTWLKDGQIQIRFDVFDTNNAAVAETLSYGVTVAGSSLTFSNLSGWGSKDVTKYHRLKRTEVGKLDIDDFKNAQIVSLPPTASPEDVVAALFEKPESTGQKVTTYKILNVCRVVTGRGSPLLVKVDSNLGQLGIYLEYDRPQIGGGPLRGWCCRVENPTLEKRERIIGLVSQFLAGSNSAHDILEQWRDEDVIWRNAAQKSNGAASLKLWDALCRYDTNHDIHANEGEYELGQRATLRVLLDKLQNEK